MSTKYWLRVLPVLLLAGIMVIFISPIRVQANGQIAALTVGTVPVKTQAVGLEKVETRVLDTISTSGSSDFIARFVEQADLSPAYSMGWKERGEFVYNTLKEVAERSQANAIAYLTARGVQSATFIAGNDLYVKAGDLDAVTTLAALNDVASIHAPRTYHIDPVEVENPAVVTVNNPASVAPQATTDWGITDTNADDFWSAFGTQGDGILVATIDTGVDYTHDALFPNYKCGNGPHDDCWLDPGAQDCTGAGGGPCDTLYGAVYHGSHTMGTMVAENDPSLSYIAGMAPDAKWIACMGCPDGSCLEFDLNSCADWILAPGGDTDNRPNVVNNSWGGSSGDSWYLAKVQAWRAAGIFPAFSAGNSGSSCSSLGSPGDYQESFGSAAHDSSRTVASFSSRGPSAYGHTPYTKPNISAPGVNIWSTQPGNNWVAISGTSMSSPHTAGAVALLWSCNPSLIGQIEQTFQILQDSADFAPAGSCGTPPDGEGNYTYGYGYLNVYEAGLLYCGDTGTLAGNVAGTGYGPLQDATIQASLSLTQTLQTSTNASGNYSMGVGVGTYSVKASAFGFIDKTASVVVNAGQTTVQNYQLDLAPSSTLSVTVVDANTGWPLYAVSTLGGTPWSPIWNNPVTGHFELVVPNGITLTLGVDAWTPGYLHQDVVVPVSGDIEITVYLVPNLTACNAPGYHLAPNCLPLSGGLVVGNVYDAYEGKSLLGSTVDNDSMYSTVTAATEDPNVDNAFYVLFSPAGVHEFTASLNGFDADVRMVSVISNDTVEQNFQLPAPHLVFDPLSMQVSLDMGDSTTLPLTITNNGNAAATFEIAEFNPGFTPVVLEYHPPVQAASSASQLAQFGKAWVSGTPSPMVATGFTLLNQQPNQSNGKFSDSDCNLCTTGQQAVAENFSLPEATTLSQIIFWNGYYPSDTPIDPDLITVLIYRDQDGLPGIYIYGEADVTYERHQTGVTLFGVHEYIHTLTLAYPVSLDPGIYWIELYNDTSGNPDSYFWETGDLDPAYGLPGSVFATATPGVNWQYDSNTNFALQLVATVEDVPWLSESPITGTIPGSTVKATGSLLIPASFASSDPLTISAVAKEKVNPAPASAHPEALLWDQLTPSGSAQASQDMETAYDAYDIYAADDFSNSNLWTIGKITTMGGWFSPVNLMNANAIHWYIYADNGGKPLGVPGDGQEFWSLSLAPTNPQIQLGVDNVLEVVLSLNTPIHLPAGTWWLVFYPSLDYDPYGQYGWQGTTKAVWGSAGLQRNPSGGFEMGTGWFVNVNSTDYAFRLEEPLVPGSTNVDVTFDAGVPEVTQPGDYHAQLKIRSNTPYVLTTIPVTMTVNPPPTWGKLAGTIEGLGYCDSNPSPLAGAVVNIEGGTGTAWMLVTDISGYYQVWMDAANSPVKITVTAAGYAQGQAMGVNISAGFTTTQNFDLRWQQPCAVVSPDAFDVDVAWDFSLTENMDIANYGPVAMDWMIHEIAGSAALPQDGGFEAGIPNPYWDEYSTNFGTPICDTALCGTGGGTAGAHTGSYWAWFGGIMAYEEGWVIQDVVIPPGTATLSFYFWVGTTGSPAADYFDVLIDGDNVFHATRAEHTTYPAYTLVNVDVSAYADGASHILEFYAECQGSVTTSFNLDDIFLEVDVPWLAEAPINGNLANDSGIPVDVTFTAFPTMTIGDVYTASLLVQTSDSINDEINIPVTMTVVARAYGVAISADQVGSGEPEDVVTYNVTITNTSNFSTDSFNVTLGTHTFDTGLGASESSTLMVGPLTMGATATFVVTVHTPRFAQNGESETVQITVTSIGDPTKKAITSVTTNVHVSTYYIYLPLVRQGP